MKLSPGIVNRFRILAYQGAGEIGEVYLAKDVTLDRHVLLKILPDDIVRDQIRMNRFIQEAKLASTLNHPNIIAIYEVGQVDNTHFIATEYVDGVTLRQRINSGTLRLDNALDIAIQVASALSSAHQAGIIHCDIKPDNIMLGRDGYVKILDFGLTKLAEKSSERILPETVDAESGMILGTPGYMSPEQARGLALDTRTDIWSLGVVLYQMLTGRMPFEGPTATDQMVSIFEHPPTPLTAIIQNLPHEFQQIINRALHKNKEERYQTIQDMALDLRLLQRKLENEPISESTVQLRGVEDERDISEQGAVKVEANTLYINLWIEDEYQRTLTTPAMLNKDEVYRFMFAIETWSREEANITGQFTEPEELKQTSVTRVLIEVVCPFLTESEIGYLRREVDFYRGRGFPPEAFELRPANIGRFNLTARLIVKGETIYREVIGFEVVSSSSVAVPEKAANALTS